MRSRNKGERLEEAGQQQLFNAAGYRLDFTGGIGPIASSMLPQKTDWTMPTTFPDLTREKFISVDVESFDPELTKFGPGFVRGTAHIVGVSVAVPSGFKAYYPLAHKEGPNLPRNVVIPWLAEQLGSDVPKIGTNLLYDMEGLHFAGVKVRGTIMDIQNAESLLDEESALFDFNKFQEDYPEEKDPVSAYHALRGFSLDALAWKYLGKRKNEALLRQVRGLLGMKDVKGNLHKLPARFVGPYAEEDAVLPIAILAEQMKLLEKQNLERVWRLECELMHLLLAMRLKGVRVDLDAAERLNKQLREEQRQSLDELCRLAGRAVDPWRNEDLVALCSSLGIQYQRTQKGNPSFTAEWLRAQEHPALKKIVDARKIEKMRRDFVEGFVLNMNVRGRLHAQFHQLKRDEDGTRSGRFSSSNPNLQQIPARDQRFGPLIRGLFIPENGCRWFCGDYSAQEPRLTVHYAYKCKLPGAAEAVAKYNTDPLTDYHQLVADMAEILRKEAKEINLGLVYGMGVRKLAWKLGYMTEAESFNRSCPVPQEVYSLLTRYHEGVPFVKPLIEMTTNAAETRGAIATLLGRRRHFDLYEPRRSGQSSEWENDYRGALPRTLARFMYGENVPLARAFTHKALNALIQGSAADMMKLAMLNLWQLGYVPHLTVHDEVDDSIETEEQGERIKRAMIEAVQLVVPVRVDTVVCSNWGEVK